MAAPAFSEGLMPLLYRRLRWLLPLLLLSWWAPLRAQLPDTIERVKPSVVLVGGYRASDNPRFQFMGTGFVVGNGLQVVTNAHVAERLASTSADAPALVVQVRVGADAWALRKARLLESAHEQDLALLQIDGPALPALRVAPSEGVREGQELAFMGFPIGGVLGFSPVTHRALISSITTMALPSPTEQQLSARAIRSARAGPLAVFQLDATAYPGNSGGPLFEPHSGAVLGIVSMVLLKGTREAALSQPSGITYAIPSRYLIELLARHP